MRCGRCGNENVEGNRFCGMCGAPLIPTQAIPPARVPVAAAVTTPKTTTGPDATTVESTIPPPLRSTPDLRSNDLQNNDLRKIDLKPPAESSFNSEKSAAEPLIAGPSFLGLNKPSVNQGHDGRSQQSSGNLDYLLDDEEEPKRGWGKLLLVLLALALAGGFGYLHWKQGGFAWVNGEKKTVAATPDSTPSAPDSGNTTASANNPSDSGSAQTNTSQATAQNPVAPSAEPQSSAPQNLPAQNAAAPDASSQPAASGTTQNAPAATQPGDNPLPPASAPSVDAAADKPPAAGKPIHSRAEARKPPAPKATAAKPAAVDPVAEAERYINGRGVHQDCDRGMHMLKQAAQESNVKAMISLGARYSSGTCAPRDLPTSYRWFALALHKEPDNPALQDDLQKLWAQMTQPERQLAIKLSQ